ncbi:MAG: helix-turn-helix domain-containing protein [Planctomycetota bacterium]|nr:helix-turn-helix domain-containing protein [Planctomycetota bacterium]
MQTDSTHERSNDAAEATPAPMLLTPRQAANTLAISTRKLWSLTNCGEVPSLRIGRLVRYDPADLRQWIELQKTTPRAR